MSGLGLLVLQEVNADGLVGDALQVERDARAVGRRGAPVAVEDRLVDHVHPPALRIPLHQPPVLVGCRRILGEGVFRPTCVAQDKAFRWRRFRMNGVDQAGTSNMVGRTLTNGHARRPGDQPVEAARAVFVVRRAVQRADAPISPMTSTPSAGIMAVSEKCAGAELLAAGAMAGSRHDRAAR